MTFLLGRMEYISKEKYEALHTSHLRRTPWKVNCVSFHSYFGNLHTWRDWGDKFQTPKREAVPLVNLNGEHFEKVDPSCWPLDRWNFLKSGRADTPEEWNAFYESVLANKTEELLLDVDFSSPTKHMAAEWANPLKELKPYLTRSCILRWQAGARFRPHVDTWHPVRWLRLWGTTTPDKVSLRYRSNRHRHLRRAVSRWNDITKENEFYASPEIPIEAGRLYLHDSMVWHEAEATADDAFQFFISIHPRAYDFLFSSIH